MVSSLIPVPFAVDVTDEVLLDLNDRLARTRFPSATPGGWRAGTDPGYLRELVAYWLDEFDWRAQERRINAVPHYTAVVGSRRVHFVHIRAATTSTGRPAVPLVVTHGWPSSFVEMLPLAVSLADPGASGGDSDEAFDMVVPSLPGFLFSEIPAHGAVTPPVIAGDCCTDR